MPILPTGLPLKHRDVLDLSVPGRPTASLKGATSAAQTVSEEILTHLFRGMQKKLHPCSRTCCVRRTSLKTLGMESQSGVQWVGWVMRSGGGVRELPPSAELKERDGDWEGPMGRVEAQGCPVCPQDLLGKVAHRWPAPASEGAQFPCPERGVCWWKGSIKGPEGQWQNIHPRHLPAGETLTFKAKENSRSIQTHIHRTGTHPKSICKWEKHLGKTPHAHHQYYWMLRDHRWIFFFLTFQKQSFLRGKRKGNVFQRLEGKHSLILNTIST